LTLYDKGGNVISATEYALTSLARTTVTQYDAANRPVTVIANYTGAGSFDPSHPDQNLTRFSLYGPVGERQATVELRGGPGLGAAILITTTYGYDNLGRLLTTTAPLTGASVAMTTRAYDGLDRVTDTTDPVSHTTHTDYDGLGRPITATTNYINGGAADNQSNLRTVATYDAASNRVTVTDPKLNATQFKYDLLNRLVSVTDALTGTTHYAYDAASNLLAITDANSNSITRTYDLLNRLVSTTDPLAHVTQTTYDAAGNPVVTLDAKGQSITTAYDLLNRPVAITYPAPDAAVRFAYDQISRRTAMTDSQGTTTWTYDGVDRALAINQPYTGTVQYTYDSAGDRLSLTFPDGQVVAYRYDLATRLAQATDWLTQTTSYLYNGVGQPLTVTLPNGVTSSFGYDAGPRPGGYSQTLSNFEVSLNVNDVRNRLFELAWSKRLFQ
jgi:YD repeat-containing protein